VVPHRTALQAELAVLEQEIADALAPLTGNGVLHVFMQRYGRLADRGHLAAEAGIDLAVRLFEPRVVGLQPLLEAFGLVLSQSIVS